MYNKGKVITIKHCTPSSGVLLYTHIKIKRRINMYTIEVDYTTGGSFSSERQTEEIGLVFSTKELARKALLVIKEHNTLYKEADSYHFRKTRTDAEINEEGNNSQWCLDACRVYREQYKTKVTSHDRWRYYVAVEVSPKEYRSLNVCMWTGYFEKLHSAKVISIGDDEDYLEF
tara:strand:- start:1175 stop:1693 length:519 start_codon:yes stop_codon:yes gene_type:complete